MIKMISGPDLLILPLLIQLICLHSVSAVRDRLLRVLFNLFGPEYNCSSSSSGSQTITSTTTPTYPPTVDSSNHTALLIDCNQHRALTLHACHLIASYLGKHVTFFSSCFVIVRGTYFHYGSWRVTSKLCARWKLNPPGF
ncbi:unnamed protein product [Echinostoma caproni]|uniref:Secreted protein n=1 Tax=Echinostoma caproni TaxID=27848 RepID=A0A183B274_9TREM|nr:unnamed protein product [Echinostoma caproni]